MVTTLAFILILILGSLKIVHLDLDFSKNIHFNPNSQKREKSAASFVVYERL